MSMIAPSLIHALPSLHNFHNLWYNLNNSLKQKIKVISLEDQTFVPEFVPDERKSSSVKWQYRVTDTIHQKWALPLKKWVKTAEVRKSDTLLETAWLMPPLLAYLINTVIICINKSCQTQSGKTHDGFPETQNPFLAG